ncbi:hypothetical protein [Jannaschia seohaensis]|uniref:Lipoprotein n=1 Tax=Jannaschia seohaensis TaxID=475081 RepID=A0A2Y9AAG3_9RHOB|nr:hypothetical protein [Jannaschia seohaensis]PWJ20860.1 hypothetical protein BCF38_102106 [Jannaschia seohaensis]SSA41270.1 hypothetical protein SAMN05421539_102106 [Jannaschia seohaensis]
MRKATLAAGLALLALAGCGGGGESGGGGMGIRAFDFSNNRDVLDELRARLGEPLVDQVVSMELSPTPGGVIVSAVGLPPTQGFWDATLVRVPTDEAATLLLEFRLLPPVEPRPVGTQPSREVLAGTFLSRQDLAGIRTVAIQAQRNRATSRR